jgi:hypothetical protein
MEEPRIPKTEEGEAEPQHNQQHARVFRHSRDCAPRIYPQRPDCEHRVLLQCSSPSEAGHLAKMTWNVAHGQLAALWRQCTFSPSSRNMWVCRSQQHYHTSASTLLTRFGPLRLLLLSEDEAAAKGSLLWQCGGYPAGIAESPWYTLRTGLPAVATALGSMCRCTWGLFWRGCCPNLNQVNTF